ncbi:hypothetical protein [Armatimonas rosea]|uniref:Uncharacterized protein n=1 Tax=Armatimonas rosea TaxID=685828 RepID=A0A7W9SWH3_ARMRO|nr:hypothetical protein [Armatimonas rosea]MBB6054132.1 hypothetical protein [Armatimonas rosea]
MLLDELSEIAQMEWGQSLTPEATEKLAQWLLEVYDSLLRP